MFDKYRHYEAFIESYKTAVNASTGSKYDSNANVSFKNITTLHGELFNKDAIMISRMLMYDKLKEIYGENIATNYISDLENHLIYKHDETKPLYPYCASITMYPFLIHGLETLGGVSKPPKNLDSFCGGFINLVYAVSSQLAGAVSTPEFLTYLDYFIRKDYGQDYYKNADKIVVNGVIHKSIKEVITDKFQQVVYSINTPASARNFQSVFWNIAYFDKPYFDGIFENFFFPDGTKPCWTSVSWLQKLFMKWFNKERLKKELTFPVETMNLLNNGESFVDSEWADFTAEMYSEGHSFFTYTSDSVDSLASCCRLRNAIQSNDFSYTLGAGGVCTGSKCVITLNINRIVQLASSQSGEKTDYKTISNKIQEVTQRVHKYLTAYNSILSDLKNAGLIGIYDAEFILPEKQYLTVGINGLVEGAEYLGIKIDPFNEKYYEYIESILKPIHTENVKDRTDETMFNTELVPAENLGVKFAKWDKEDGYFTPRDCYNSYFYIVEDAHTNPIDKLMLHGERVTKYLDGGSAVHINLDEHLSYEQYKKLLLVMIKTGCSYATVNVPNTICNKCGHISKRYTGTCEVCGSHDLDYLTRIIGYLKRISKFSETRQEEERNRYYAGTETFKV